MIANTYIIANVYLSWLPAWSVTGFACLLAVCLLLWVLVRLIWGASQVRGRLGLWVLRSTSLLILAIILLGPTIVDEQVGEVVRPSMLFLFDGSQSMLLGQTETRWDESLRFVDQAQQSAGGQHSGNVQSFRFGHRLEPLAKPAVAAGNVKVVSAQLSEQDRKVDNRSPIGPPNATDSRLADALRQLLPQVNAKQSAGIVLLSDGRVRASESVEKLAEFFGKSKVPLHVVPIGRASGDGDIAIVSLVVPPRVRKYTENEIQVFIRSYGFTGQRTTVRVVSRHRIADAQIAPLASVPITLSGGAQSASLTFRVNEQPEDLVVMVDPIDGELTGRNNQIATRVEIDRTKVRVLYLESDLTVSQQTGFLSQLLSLAGGTSRSTPTGALTVQEALQADEDVECTVLVSHGGSAPESLSTSNSVAGAIRFPKTRAELFAYDCVVFSDLGPNVLTTEQSEWLAQWVEGRGGGLIVTGSEALNQIAWQDSPLLPLLPIHLANSERAFGPPVEVDVVLPQHAIWRLRLEQKLNEQMLSQLPSLSISGSGYQVKSTAEILARQRADDTATMFAHRAGRGRVLVSTASLGGRAFTSLVDNWGPQPERVAAKFWRNLVYWSTEGSSTGRRRLVADSDKQFYRPGEPLSILATAYDEGARRTDKYRVWAMFEPASLDDASLYSPLLWPDSVVRDSGEVSPRIAWGEELPLTKNSRGDGYVTNLMLSETGGAGDSGLRIELTAYEGAESESAFDHGTQVDSNSLAIQILSDPFEQQNPLPNHELLTRLSTVSGGKVLDSPEQLATLLKNRNQTVGPPHRDVSPAWSKWWLWIGLMGLLTAEWVWRRVTGLA